MNPIFICFEYTPRTGIAGLYERSMFNFCRKLYFFPYCLDQFTFPTFSTREPRTFHWEKTVSAHDACQQYIKVPNLPHLHQYLLSLVLRIVILTCVSWFLIVVLFCISLIVKVEYVSMYLFTTLMSFLEKCLFNSYAYLKNWIACFFVVDLAEFFIFWISITYQYMVCKILPLWSFW